MHATSKYLENHTTLECDSPFVLSAPLAKSAPSKVCPSAAKRSFSVSISLRTESQTDYVFKDSTAIRQTAPCTDDKCDNEFNYSTECVVSLS